MTADELKRLAAARALEHVRDGMTLGLGTGSTAKHFVELLGDRVKTGLTVIGVPTSEQTRLDAERCGVPLTTLDEIDRLDLTIDGADEIDPALNVIKGGGGALLREKIVATAAHRMVVIADASKEVATLGRFPLPVEVNRFGLGATRRLIAELCRDLGLPDTAVLRVAKTTTEPFVTDGGHLILDLHLGAMSDPERLAEGLVAIPGVVEHGLFIGLASTVVLAASGGTRLIEPKTSNTEQI